MKKHPIWYMVIGIAILVIPSVCYLFWLVPQLSEEYNVLMASGGIIGTSGLYLSDKIPDGWNHSKILKFISKGFTMLTFMTLVEKFWTKIVILLVIVIFSVSAYVIFKEVYRNAKRRIENTELATEVARSVNKNS